MSDVDLFPPFEDKDVSFAQLKGLINSKRPPIALIGAGASISSGYPTWAELLSDLKVEAGSLAQHHWKMSTEDLSDAPWTAEVFSQALGPKKLKAIIERKFASRHKLADPHLAIAKMPFKHFLTTNYDPSIEEALARAKRKYKAIQWYDDDDLSAFLIGLSQPDLDPHVVYLHGKYDSPLDDIILTETSYVGRYIKNDDARRKLMAIFMTHPVVFIGFSMNDPDLANLMREVTARLRSKEPNHFALMGYQKESDREATRARMKGKFGVTPVFFSGLTPAPGVDEFSNMNLLLDALVDKKTSLLDKKKLKITTARQFFDPEDPNKGRFGGHDRDARAGRVLSAMKLDGSEAEGYLRLRLRLAPTSAGKGISGIVEFHLHPTFKRATRPVIADNGVATLDIAAYGAFTVGVVADDGQTRLELDLSSIADLPLWFRRR